MKKGVNDFLLPNTVSVNAFRNENKRKVELANGVLQIEWEIVSAITQIPDIHWLVSSHLQTIHEYHHQALLMAMSKRPEIGMAVMRMACELTRDLCRIAEDPARVDLWLGSRSEDGHLRHGKDYRQVFRFSTDDDTERGLYDLYNVFSNFGVHGHLPMMERLAMATEINSRTYMMVRRDPKTAITSFMLTLMCADLHSVLMLSKFKSAADGSGHDERDYFGVLCATYMERMGPFHRYVEIYRAKGDH